MQFNIDEMFDNINSPPSIIDVSSESGEEFTVKPGGVQTLVERFRVGCPGTNAMSAFEGAAAATLFPSSSHPHQSEKVSDTTGSQNERQLMELVEEHQNHDSVSSPSFIDTELRNIRNHQKTRIWTIFFRSPFMTGPPLQFYKL